MTEARLSRRLVARIALIAAVAEAVDAFFIEFPPAAIFFVLFAAGWLWIRRGGIGGIVLVTVLFLVELVTVPSYPATRSSRRRIAFSQLRLIAPLPSRISSQ